VDALIWAGNVDMVALVYCDGQLVASRIKREFLYPLPFFFSSSRVFATGDCKSKQAPRIMFRTMLEILGRSRPQI
jgi:hypothetical protein